MVEDDSFEAKIAELSSARTRDGADVGATHEKLTNSAFDVALEPFVAQYLEYQQQSMASPEHQQAMAAHRLARTGH